MIVKEYGKFILICDICGEEVDGFETFYYALDYTQDEGWESKIGERLDLSEGYIDICPICGDETIRKCELKNNTSKNA